MKRGVDPLVPLLALSALLLGLIALQLRGQIAAEPAQTPLNLSDSTHRMEVFFLVYVFRTVEPALRLRRSALRGHPRGGSASRELESVPRRRNYCLANFLAATANARAPNTFLFADVPNRHALKRSLSDHFDLLNTPIFAGAARRGKWGWDPRLGLLLTASDLTRVAEVGRSLLGAFQAASGVPGAAALHRLDLLLDAGAAQEVCFSFRAHLPRAYRLYDAEECKAFFGELRTKKFKERMRTQTVFVVHDTEVGEEFVLDWPRTQQLRRQYQQGALCGRNARRLLALGHVHDTLRYADGQAFKLRVFAHYASTAPSLLYFHPGVVVVEAIDGEQRVVAREALEAFLGSPAALARAYDDIKRVVTRLNHLSMRRLLPDPRFFQSIALDFVLDASYRPLLVAASPSIPLRKAYDAVHRAVLSLQAEVLEERNERVRAFVQEGVHRLNKAFSARQPQSWEQGLAAMELALPPRQLREQFRQVFRNSLPTGRLPAGLELLFDGTRQGAEAYPSPLSPPCAA